VKSKFSVLSDQWSPNRYSNPHHPISLTMSTPSPPGPRRNPSQKSKTLTLSSIQEDSSPPDESPSYDPNAERNEQRPSKNNVTPEKRKKWGSSVDTKQRARACEADPHKGRCLLTNLADAVNVCHLIPSSTRPSEVSHFHAVTSCPDPFLAHEIGVCMGSTREPQP